METGELSGSSTLERPQQRDAAPRAAGVTRLTLVVLAAVGISVGAAAVAAAEPRAIHPPNVAEVAVANVGTGWEPPANRARAAPASCPYHFGDDMPPDTFCVYQGDTFGSAGEECAADVVVIWSASTPPGPAGKESEVSSDVYLGFVDDPALVLRAIAETPQTDRAELVEYTVESEDAAEKLAGMMALRSVRAGANAMAEVLSVELHLPPPLRLRGCAFASYAGVFIGVIRPPGRTDHAVEASTTQPR